MNNDDKNSYNCDSDEFEVNINYDDDYDDEKNEVNRHNIANIDNKRVIDNCSL